MADIRINSLPTTASSSASDDYVALDGSANGTRKLSAYSPTFGGNATVGGNLTVSGTTASTFSGDLVRSRSGAGVTGTPVTDYVARLGNAASPSSAGLLATNIGGSNYRTSVILRTTDAAGAAVDAATFDYAGNTTLAGNLTVSGTLTTLSNFTVQTSASGFDIRNTSSTAGLSAIYGGTAFNNGAGILLGGSTHATNANLITFTTGAFVETGRITASGNWLLGTTTDSGQKLQVAGNVKIANDLFIFGGNASSAGSITANSAAGGLYFYNQGTSTSMRFYTTDGAAANQLALTLDSSQNATFAGKLYSVSGTATTPAFSFTGDTGTGMYRSSAGIGALAASGSTAAFWASNVFAIYSGVPLRLGNAYTAGAPTATGYVTIQDSAGNTYKVLVGT